jgi:acyl dehydratase
MRGADLSYYDDYAVGQRIALGPYAVTADDILDFAAEFDPQAFHLDDVAGKASLLGGLSASGWHVSSMLMRMIVDQWLGHSAGMGSNTVEDMRWLRPVLAGDTLHGHIEILSKRVSAKRPEMGILHSRFHLFNQRGEATTEMTAIVFMRMRAPC